MGHYSTAFIGHLLCTKLCGNVGSIPAVWHTQYWVAMVTCLWPGSGRAAIFPSSSANCKIEVRAWPAAVLGPDLLAEGRGGCVHVQEEEDSEASHDPGPAGGAC